MAQIADKDIANSSGAGVRSDLNNAFPAVATNNFGPKAQAGQILPCEFVADSSTSKLLIRSTTGNDGTGGTTPTYFDVGNLDEANLGLVKRAGDTLTGPLELDDSSGASSPALSFDGDSDTGIFRSGANTMGFSTAGTQRVGISNAGLDMLNALPIRFQDTSGSPFVSLQSPSSLSSNVALTLPSSIINGGFLQTDGSGNLSFQIVNGVPSGAVFCVAVATVPTGYLECNGAAVSRSTYAALFAFIGITYGSGNGSSTFNLPDLRGEFVRGYDHGRGVDSGREINDPQGSANLSHGHSVSASVSDPGHVHTTSVDNKRLFTNPGPHHIPYGGAGGYPGTNWSMSTATTGVSVSISQNNAGGSEARPRNVSMMYIIKT
tara:strand:- start:3 stop:1133 length:1131 start_codon:yes stop_codon:yes gene_type:complete